MEVGVTDVEIHGVRLALATCRTRGRWRLPLLDWDPFTPETTCLRCDGVPVKEAAVSTAVFFANLPKPEAQQITQNALQKGVCEVSFLIRRLAAPCRC